MELPILSAGKLILRPITEKDTAALFRLYSNQEVTHFMDIDAFANISEATQIITFFREMLASKEGMRWGITLLDHDELIGTCGFHRISRTHFKAEIGYDLFPDFWGKGIMTEAAGILLTYGYQELQLNRIEAFVDLENIASSRLLTKLGFRFEGLLRDAFFEKGRFVNAQLYSLLRREHAREAIWE
ncbi:GNAT family N-acetyltransferase [Chitinophaga sp. MM2321]|uniref:GNAT family N-acetyltransferase n=1 Tax=Chitinophaga sp. MM2321 TaxID=3137178 RepID=UPI0032D59F07